MAPGLPYPCEVGAEDCAEPQKGDRIVPLARWEALRLQLLDCGEYQGLCRDSLAETDRVWRVVLRGALAAQAARLAADEVVEDAKDSGDWPAWEVYVLTAAVILGGLAAGFGVGALWATLR